MSLLFLVSVIGMYSQKKNKGGDLSEEPLVVKSYQPISPLSMYVINATATMDISNKSIVEALPDKNTWFSIRELNQSQGANYSSILEASNKKTSYQIVFDWIRYNTSMAFIIKDNEPSLLMPYKQYLKIKENELTPETKEVKGDVIKLFAGIGIRVKANVYAKKRGVTLSNIISIGAEVSDEKVTGTLEVQNMGITGESVTSLITMPSELSKSSIQNTLMSIAAIREKIYTIEDKETEGFQKVQITPRIIGYENLSNKSYTEGEIQTFIYKAIPCLVVNIPKRNNAYEFGVKTE